MDVSSSQTTRAIGRPARRIAAWTGFPVAAVATVWLWTVFADAVGAFGWGPLRRVSEVVAYVPQPARSIGIGLIAALVGLAMAALAQWTDQSVHVDRHGLTVRSGLCRRDHISAEHVAAVFVDGTDLVVNDVAGWEWCRVRHDGDVTRLHGVFARSGYPWFRRDPHIARFQRWEPGTAHIPPAVDRLLGRRADAVADWTDARARSLAEELRACGVIVRDDDRQQYWRAVGLIR